MWQCAMVPVAAVYSADILGRRIDTGIIEGPLLWEVDPAMYVSSGFGLTDPSVLSVCCIGGAQTREEILKVSMAQNRVDASVNFTAITAELEGFTGSDIKEVGCAERVCVRACVRVCLLLFLLHMVATCVTSEPIFDSLLVA